MVHTSLLILTSPLMAGPAPVAAAVEIAASTTPAIETPTNIETSEIIPLGWSLVPQEDETPQGGESPQTGDAEIIVEGEVGPAEGDPMGDFNEESFRITQELDDVFLQPVAYAYRDGLPRPIRDGLGNVVRNLSEPANFLNFLLQLKVGKAFETLGRFAINSTLGIGGLIDIAEKPGFSLPYRRNGFANTLGFYGVGPGPYLYLPVTGATTVRDLIGNSLNQLVLPTVIGNPFNTPEYAIPVFIVSSLDARLEVDAELDRIEDTVDPYAARRDTYLYRREREIAELRGEEPPPPPAILREVEGTGEFSEDFEEGEPDGNDEESLSHHSDTADTATRLVVTRPLASEYENPRALAATR